MAAVRTSKVRVRKGVWVQVPPGVLHRVHSLNCVEWTFYFSHSPRTACFSLNTVL